MLVFLSKILGIRVIDFQDLSLLTGLGRTLVYVMLSLLSLRLTMGIG
jgi:hypothetical protein